MKRIEEITKMLAAHKEELRESYKVKEPGIFGSFVRGEQEETSDLDILVEFFEVPDLLDFINLERYLQRMLKKKVDLVRKPVVRKELRNRILNEVVYA